MKDWKTTVAGIVTIVGTLCTAALHVYNHQAVDMPTTIAGLTAGVGLIKAADSK
jgi:hypothetical protein